MSKDTISRITDAVVEQMTEWCNRPLDQGQVANRPVHVAIGLTCNSERDILGLWAGDGGESTKFWLSVPTEMPRKREVPPEPRRRGRLQGRLRRVEGPARVDHHPLAAGGHADMGDPPAAQHLLLRLNLSTASEN